MFNQKSLILSLVASSLALSGFTASRADTIETTVTQTSTTSAAIPVDIPVYQLSASGTYHVVDPITGRMLGKYDQATRFVDGQSLQSGVVIVDQSNGNLVATVDSTGRVVDIGRAPASQTLIVSIDSRRQDLNRRINEALTKGQITSGR